MMRCVRPVSLVLAGLVALTAAVRVAHISADVTAAPAWRLGGGVTAAIVHGGTVYVGGSFSQLFTPSTSAAQFYDPVTALARPECARNTNPAAGLNPTPDGTGGLLVAVQPGDAFADEAGAFEPPPGTTIVRIASTCLWDRAFAAGVVNPSEPGNLTIGLPVRAGNIVYAANAIIAPDTFLRAQMAAFNAVTGDRIVYREFPDIAEIGLLGAGPQGPVARVRLRDSFDGQFVLATFNPDTLEVTWSATPLADEPLNPKFWVRGTTLFRLRPPPTNTLEAYDLTTLAPKAGWVPPLVPALADLEVVGSRVFVTSRTVNGQPVRQPAALLAATGAVDTAWTPPVLERRGPDPPTPYTPVLTHLATDGQRLFFSGDMQRVNAIDREGVAALRLSDASLDDWNPAPVIADPLEFTVGGLLMTRPVSGNRVMRRYLAAIDAATGVATAWDPNDLSRILLHNATPVSALATDGTYLYFASSSTGELQRAHLVSADVDENWRFLVLRADGRPGNIDTIVERDGTLYLAGEFDSVGGVGVPRASRYTLAAVGTDGSLLPWAPVLEGPPGVKLVRAMLRLGGAVYLGGAFTLVNGEVRMGFAAVDAVTHELVQPEMVRPGYTRINGLATDGARVFLAGESFGAPLVGAAAIPTSVLTPFRVYDGQIPASTAYVAGGLYAGLEYDPDALGPSSRATRWHTVIAGPSELLHLTAADGTLEFYPGQPGATPGAPTLTASVTGNVVALAWTRSATGAAPSNYTLVAGSAPGASNILTASMGSATGLITAAPNGAYYVRVIPRNRFGAGTPSNEVFVRVGPEPCTTAPPSPTNLAFTTAGLAVRLTWNAAATAANYTVEAGRTPGAVDLANFPVGNVTALTTSAPPAVYFVRTRAHNACGTSAPSNEVTITLGGPVEVPLPPTDLAAFVSGRTVVVRWTPPTSGGLPSGFLLEAGSAPGLSNIAVFRTETAGLVADSVPPATYYVRVRSYNSAGLGAATSDIAVTVP